MNESALPVATALLVVPGHEDVAVEKVVEQHDGYLVVEKTGVTPGQVARENDPR